jgi:hypothetical protein
LIYSGRLPSLRIRRRHYLRAASVELERRRRLGLRLVNRKPRSIRRPRVAASNLPFAVVVASGMSACAGCGREIRAGAWAVRAASDMGEWCSTCGRRLVLDWSDLRRLEAAAARRIADELRSTSERDEQTRHAA